MGGGGRRVASRCSFNRASEQATAVSLGFWQRIRRKTGICVLMAPPSPCFQALRNGVFLSRSIPASLLSEYQSRRLETGLTARHPPYFPSVARLALGVSPAFRSPMAYWIPARKCSSIIGFQNVDGLCPNTL